MREFLQASLIPAELKSKMELYDRVHDGTDAHEVSNEGRRHAERQWQTELIYGEVVFQFFIPLLEYAKPKAGEVFYDLGCGAGKPLVTASIAYPELKVCKGIEFLEGLANLAKEITTKSQEECKKQGIEYAPIVTQQGDILKTDWSDADLIFTNSPMFPDELVGGISKLCEKLKKGTRIISLKQLPAQDYLKEYAVIKIKMSWGLQVTYFYLIV